MESVGGKGLSRLVSVGCGSQMPPDPLLGVSPYLGSLSYVNTLFYLRLSSEKG